MRQRHIGFLAAALAVLVVAPPAWSLAPKGPTQPATGPGGSEYAHAGVASTGPFFTRNKPQTPANRYFGFSHVLDGGWTGDHYCRSWQMLGLAEYGPIVNVDETAAPYGNSRRLITDGDVGNNADRAHSSVTPGRNSVKDGKGGLAHEAVWKYLYTRPVEEVGSAVPLDPDCKVGPRR